MPDQAAPTCEITTACARLFQLHHEGAPPRRVSRRHRASLAAAETDTDVRDVARADEPLDAERSRSDRAYAWV